MPAIWIGASFVLVGLVSMAARPLWRAWPGRGSVGSPAPAGISGGNDFDASLDLGSNPGVALIAMGVILLLAGMFELWGESPVPNPA